MTEGLLPCPKCGDTTPFITCDSMGNIQIDCSCCNLSCRGVAKEWNNHVRDLVKVTRCKDCEHLWEEYDDLSCSELSESAGETVFINDIETFFCGFGEPRKGGE